MDVTIAIDAMGGDHGTHVTIPAAVEYLRKNPNDSIILVGQKDVIENELRQLKASISSRMRICAASEIVGMDESPQLAMRSKKDSSMRVAINLVKNGEASACVSAGNTGALMAMARYVLKTLPGIDRPAIASHLPTNKGQVLHNHRPLQLPCSRSFGTTMACWWTRRACTFGPRGRSWPRSAWN